MSLRLDCAHMKNLGRWVVGRILGKRHFCLKRCYLTAVLSFFKKKGHFCQSKDTSVFKRTLLLVFFTKKKVYNAVKKKRSCTPKGHSVFEGTLLSLLFKSGRNQEYEYRKWGFCLQKQIWPPHRAIFGRCDKSPLWSLHHTTFKLNCHWMQL